jgi:8-oxo-dGTP pyrophosphatase MutT (NUDIX family)
MNANITSSGVVVPSTDGRVYVRKVAGGYGGYKWSFAKGRIEPGLTLEQNALKELREEMGLEARIVAVLGDYGGDTGTTRFFIGEATGGDTKDIGPETDEVRLVAYDEASQLLNRQRDRDVLDDLYTRLPELLRSEGDSPSG